MVAFSVNQTDLVFQGTIFTAAATLWSLSPSIISRWGDIKHFAHAADFKCLLVIKNKLKFYF